MIFEEYEECGKLYEGMYPCLNCPCPWQAHFTPNGCDNVLYEDQETGEQQQCFCSGFAPDNLTYIEMLARAKENETTDLF